MNYETSIIIPARNEEWLSRTIEGVLENTSGDCEVICIADGAWPDPPVKSHPRVTLIHHAKAIGQRAATNEGIRLSKAKYICKLDAHCILDKDFDKKMVADYQDGWLLIPTQWNLHAFNWKCKKCGREWDQGPPPQRCMIEQRKTRSPNPDCDNTIDFERVVIWEKRTRTQAWRFDSDLIFGYFGELADRQHGHQIIDTMSLLGACWFQSREKYWELGGLDEAHSSWGQMGTELACKNWLSGGAVKVTTRTFFAHLFRTQGNFSFPYPNPTTHQARSYSQDLWRNNKWPKAIHPLSWLIEKFAPIPGWTQEDLAAQKEREKGLVPANTLTKGIVYYTDGRLEGTDIGEAVKDQLRRSVNGHEIVSVSLKPIQFGRNVVLDHERGTLTYFKQILAGLEASTATYIFLCEHDVLYNESHFSFVPPRNDVYYYNRNVWRVRSEDGHCLHYLADQVSGLCAYRELLIQHYRKRVERVEKEGYNRRTGYEPGMRLPPTGIDSYGHESWMSPYPNIDVRIDGAMSKSRWHPSEFRNPKTCLGWTEAEGVIGWDNQIRGRFQEFIANLRS